MLSRESVGIGGADEEQCNAKACQDGPNGGRAAHATRYVLEVLLGTTAEITSIACVCEQRGV